METGESSSLFPSPLTWKLVCPQKGWSLSASLDASEVEEMGKYLFMLRCGPAAELPWMVFCLCFRSLWHSVRKSRHDQWMDAFETYARWWVQSMDIDLVLDGAKYYGRFVMDIVHAFRDAEKVLMVLAFADPARVDVSRIPLCLDSLQMAWLNPWSCNPDGDRSVGMILKQATEHYDIVLEEWIGSNVKLDFHRIDLSRGANVIAWYSRRRSYRPVASYGLQITPIYNSMRPSTFISRMLTGRGLDDRNVTHGALNLLHWNVKGVESEYFKPVFLKLVAEHQPDMVFLSETRVSCTPGWEVFSQLGFEVVCLGDADGEEGGMVLMWKYRTLEASITRSTYTVKQVLVEGRKPYMWFCDDGVTAIAGHCFMS